MDNEEEKDTAWHGRAVQVWHLLLVTLPIVFVLAGYIWSVERRLTVIETQVVVLHDADLDQRDHFREVIAIVRGDIRMLGEKIDRLIERLASK